MVDITYDEAETQEEAVSDSEKVETNYDTDLSTEEVYELFLNGELTVELEEEQVTIDKVMESFIGVTRMRMESWMKKIIIAKTISIIMR